MDKQAEETTRHVLPASCVLRRSFPQGCCGTADQQEPCQLDKETCGFSHSAPCSYQRLLTAEAIVLTYSVAH